MIDIAHFIRSNLRGLLLGALALASACGDDSPRSRGTSNGEPLDPGPSQEDAGSNDAGVTIDGGPGRAPTCVPDREEFSAAIDDRGSRTWDALQDGDTIHLAFEVPNCTEMAAAEAQRVEHVAFSSTGSIDKAATVAGDDACTAMRTPALAARSRKKPWLFYSSNAAGGNELFQSQLGASEAAQRLTDDSGSLADTEEFTQAIAFGEGHLLAYVNARSEEQGGVGQIVTRAIGGEEQEILPASQGSHISGLELAAFSEDHELGGVLAWVADTGDAPGIYVQMLSATGQASGNAVQLSSLVGAFSNIDIHMLPKDKDPDVAGAIVYGVSPDGQRGELRFRTIGHKGALGEEVHLTTGAINAQGIGLAPFASGYMLVFRVVTGEDTMMHVKSVDLYGNTATYAQRLLISAEPTGSAPEVFVTSDGRIITAFTDTVGERMTLRAVRAICDP